MIVVSFLVVEHELCRLRLTLPTWSLGDRALPMSQRGSFQDKFRESRAQSVCLHETQPSPLVFARTGVLSATRKRSFPVLVDTG